MSKKFKAHVFICERCTREHQLEAGVAKTFRKNVKALAKEHWAKDEVRINGSACLGKCEQGISCVLYPQGEWLFDLSPGDEEKVIAFIQRHLD